MAPHLFSPQPLRRPSSYFPTTPRDIFNHQDGECDLLPIGHSCTHSSNAYKADLIIFNKPRPKATSKTPVNLDDAVQKINHHLLRSCALLADRDLNVALAEADFALYLAEARKIYHLQSKSQLYRGFCLMEMKRWEEASIAFTRAANVRGWATRIAELKIEAEKNMNDPEEKRRRKGKQSESS